MYLSIYSIETYLTDAGISLHFLCKSMFTLNVKAFTGECISHHPLIAIMVFCLFVFIQNIFYKVTFSCTMHFETLLKVKNATNAWGIIYSVVLQQ